LEKEVDVTRIQITSQVMEIVAKPPKLYGPHAPIVVLKTSDGYACVPNNLKILSGVLGKPKSSPIF
jgi:hypothetical protein